MVIIIGDRRRVVVLSHARSQFLLHRRHVVQFLIVVVHEEGIANAANAAPPQFQVLLRSVPAEVNRRDLCFLLNLLRRTRARLRRRPALIRHCRFSRRHFHLASGGPLTLTLTLRRGHIRSLRRRSRRLRASCWLSRRSCSVRHSLCWYIGDWSLWWWLRSLGLRPLSGRPLLNGGGSRRRLLWWSLWRRGGLRSGDRFRSGFGFRFRLRFLSREFQLLFVSQRAQSRRDIFVSTSTGRQIRDRYRR